MVRTLGDLSNNDNSRRAANPFSMGRMGQDFKWSEIPAGFYITTIIMTTLWILNLLTGLGNYLINIPFLTIFSLQIWRPFFCYLVITNIITLLITLLVMFSLCMTEETENGTGRFMAQLFKRNLILQVPVTVLGALLGLMGIRVMSMGIWPVYFIYLTMRCLENPEGSTYFCMMPCPIKNKWYPVLLLLVFTLLGISGGLPIDIWIGFGLGYLATNKPWFKEQLQVSDKFAQTIHDLVQRFDGSLGKIVPLTPGETNMGGGQGTNIGGASNNASKPIAEIVRPVFVGSGVAIGGTPSNALFPNYDYLNKPADQTTSDPNRTTDFNEPSPNAKKNRHDDSL